MIKATNVTTSGKTKQLLGNLSFNNYCPDATVLAFSNAS
jgi:hypothetical protein